MRRLRVVYSENALEELDGIADWNEVTYSRAHAKSYILFLQREIGLLGKSPLVGRQVEDRPWLRYLNIRRKPKGHGHVAVYQVEGQTVHILHLFHTAQDWRTLLPED